VFELARKPFRLRVVFGPAGVVVARGGTLLSLGEHTLDVIVVKRPGSLLPRIGRGIDPGGERIEAAARRDRSIA
jgi:hypothetical protein